MNGMMGMTDPRELANAKPFDRAFIDAMIPHHESAIEMADVALESSANEEVRTSPKISWMPKGARSSK
jgi:uncharacterized protein (DUF305 family)